MKKSLALLALAGMLVSCQLPHSGNVAKENVKGLTEATTEVTQSRFAMPGVNGDHRPTKSMTGDIDGDGKTDLLIQYNDENGGYVWEARLSTGSSFKHTKYDWTTSGTKNIDLIDLKDFNGDGKDDMLLGFDHHTSPVRMWSVRLSTGDSFRYNGSWTEAPLAGLTKAQLGYKSSTPHFYNWPAPLDGTYKVNKVLAGDMNGDGKADLVLQYGMGNGDGGHVWEVRPSTGTKFEKVTTIWTYTITPNVHMTDLADFNGDGKNDLYVQCDYKGKKIIQARKSIPNGFSYNSGWATTTPLAGITNTGYDPNHPEFKDKGWGAPLKGTYKVNKVLIGDVDGDSKADVVLQYNMGIGNGGHLWEMRPSTGNSFQTVKTMYTYTRTPNIYTKALEDCNGDGKADLVLEFDHVLNRRMSRIWQVRAFDGDMFHFNGHWTTTPIDEADIKYSSLGDFNGDGKTDLLVEYDFQGYRKWQARLSSGTDFRLTSYSDWTKVLLK